MQLNDAITLLTHNTFHPKGNQVWADLGCGSGLFTIALANILEPQSIIYAIDNDKSVLKKIAAPAHIDIRTEHLDFIKDDLKIKNADGILMANSLHYVMDKPNFLQRLQLYLNAKHSFLIIEYDTDRPVSTWVPFPIRFESLKQLFTGFGYRSINKLHEHPSVYHNGKMYSALINR